jgi:catechol 2,3-dioxygenase-like lactoylglutathione lyase family enzyme
LEVERVDFVNVPTRDYERSIAFYRDVIGLPQNPRVRTEFEAGNVTLALFDPTEADLEFETNGCGDIALRVPDVEAARKELEAKGVSFAGTRDSGVCHMAFFNDPDGNRLILHRRYAP